MTAWQQIVIIAVGNVTFFALQVAYFHWKRREGIPDELHKDIKQLQKDLVAVRGRVLYIEGRLNGKHWLRE